MTDDTHAGDIRAVPCCPELKDDCPCDVLDFHYRLTYRTTVRIGQERRIVPVEVKIHARIERCPGPLALGDLVYSTTLLPGETVRLFTSDRRSRFTFDSATKVSYRHEQLSTERYYMASMHDFMSDVTVRDRSRASNQSQGSWSFDSDASYGSIGFAGGASVDAEGSHNSSSVSDFLRELHSHAESSDRRSVTMTRASASVSVGEVQSRTHTQGESEDHFESSSRAFHNPNRCHAVTYYFYQINKTQTVKFTIESVTRRVIDPAAGAAITNNAPRPSGQVSVIPSGVLAAGDARLTAEAVGRQADAARLEAAGPAGAAGAATGRLVGAGTASAVRMQELLEPIPTAVRDRALRQVDQELVAAGLLDKPGGDIAPGAKARLSFERCSSIPTPGLIVRGCLDECDVCEPAVKKAIELELEHKRLQNEHLKKTIELMDQDQEHRCCPPAPVTPSP